MITGDQTWKTRRLRNNSAVRAQACDLRGRPRSGAPVYSGTGTVSTSAEDLASAEQALAAKYGWQFWATKMVDGLKARFGRGPAQKPVAVELTLHSA